MDSRIVKKMNEIIGALKVVERELANCPSIEDKQKLVNVRRKDIDFKMDELQNLMATIMADAQTINFHKQLKDEASKVLNVSACAPKRYF